MITRSPDTSNQASKDASPIEAHILIIEAPYYADVAEELMAGAVAQLRARGATYEVVAVEGALEIPQALGAAIDAGTIPRTSDKGRFNGVLALGCIIRGETSHYDVVVNNANHWLMQLAVEHGIPLGNAILTVDTKEQAMARAGGGHEGKGGDAARACLGLIELRTRFGARNS